MHSFSHFFDLAYLCSSLFLFWHFHPISLGLNAVAFGFVFGTPPPLFFFSSPTFPVFGFLFLFSCLSGCAFRRQTVKGAQRHGLTSKQRETYTKNIRGRVDGKENKGLGEDRGKQHTKDVWRMFLCGASNKQKLGWQEERRGFFGGARKKGIKSEQGNKKTQTLNIPRETRRVLPGVVLGGSMGFCANRVTFQFISPSMLIASTVFWFILFCGYVLFQHLAPLFECVLPFFFLHSKPGKPHLNLLASALSSRFLVSQSLLFFAHGFFLGR